MTPVNTPPRLAGEVPDGTIAQILPSGAPCGRSPRITTLPVTVAVSDETDPNGPFEVRVSWAGFDSGGSTLKPGGDGTFSGVVGPVSFSGDPNQGGGLDVTITARDPRGAQASLTGKVTVALCQVTAPTSPSPPPDSSG